MQGCGVEASGFDLFVSCTQPSAQSRNLSEVVCKWIRAWGDAHPPAMTMMVHEVQEAVKTRNVTA